MTFKSKARRAGWLLLVAVFAFGIFAAIKPQPTSAYSLISSRYVRMSSSEVSPASGNFTIYNVGFTIPGNNQTVGSMVIRFCSNNPIIGDSCTAPTGFNTNDTSLSVNNQTGGLTFALQASPSDDNELLFTRTPGVIAAPTTVTFELGNGSTNGITNPSTTNTTFFARIMLFATNSSVALPNVIHDDNAPTDPTNPGATDAGGVALSTANVLNVTAKVQEALTFCIYTLANCAAGGTAIALGDSNGVLAAMNTTYLNADPKFDLASNALNGVIVRMKGDTLTSGSFTITPNGASCVADSVTTSVEQFGTRVVSYGTGQYNGGAASSVVPNSGNVDDFSCLAGNHKFDPTTANVTYGQPFVRTFGATDVSTTNFELAAKAANTTEAGVYTTKLQFIATATY
jgi:hypothetical protein